MARTKLKQYKRLTDKIYKMPDSVIDVIPIHRIAENGIFELENRQGIRLFDRAYIFEDINFSTKDEDEKEEDTLKKFKQFLNSMNVSYKIIISNEPKSQSEIVSEIERTAVQAEYEPLAQAYNAMKARKLEEGRKGIRQVRYLIISCLRQDYESAKAFFNTVESTIALSFKKMGSGLLPMNAAQRLRALHNFYRMGHEETFTFDWNACLSQKRDWRHDIINTSIREYEEYLEMDGGKRYVSVLFVRRYPSGCTDNFLKDLTGVSFPLFVTMDCDPVDKEDANRILMQKYMNVQRSIDRQQESKNKAGAFSSEVSYDKRKESEELEEYLDEVRSFDQKMFYTDILIAVCADSKEQLEENILEIQTIGAGQGFEIETHIYNQLDALNTTLPTASRFVSTMRVLFTDALAGFVPFDVQEINDPEGLWYGINQVSKNGIIGNRKLLKNGNGFLFGKTGAGKSEAAKAEMGQVLAHTEDDILIIDPMREYREIVNEWNGQYFDFAASMENENRLNPFHVPEHITDEVNFISEKAEFAYAVCEQAIKPEPLTNKHINVIDRAVKEMYHTYFSLKKKQGYEHTDSPTMITLSDKFKAAAAEGSVIAEDLAEQMEVFVTGTLNMFSHQEHVSGGGNQRLTGYGLSGLGAKMKPLAMLVVMESVTSRIKYNQENLKATWVYLDEVHEMWKDEYTMYELEKLWREVRKRGGLCTGMTQFILDGMQNASTKTMIGNSEFTVLLEQGSVDRENLYDVFEISNAQLVYVNGVEAGTGLIRFGKKIVPFDNIIDSKKDKQLHDLFNTSFHEKAKAAAGG